MVCRDSCTLSFTGWLDVPERVKYKLLGVLTYRCQHSQAPRYLIDHCSPVSDVVFRQSLRSASSHQLSVPRHRLSTYGRRAFSVAGPTVWNSLPEDHRDPECCTDSYRQSLKTFLFLQHCCVQCIRGFYVNTLYKFTFDLCHLTGEVNDIKCRCRTLDNGGPQADSNPIHRTSYRVGLISPLCRGSPSGRFTPCPGRFAIWTVYHQKVLLPGRFAS